MDDPSQRSHACGKIKLIRKDIKALAAYHVPDSSGMIKLDAMENPFPLPDKLKASWLKRLGEVELNRYPDADMHTLREKIAAKDGLNADQVLLGNGSDEIIQMLLVAADTGACASPSPTFVMYDLISRWFRRPVATIPLENDFSLNADKFLQLCTREKASIAFLACPNNPTGNMWSESTIRKIAAGFRGLLIIDEAYLPFADRTHTDLIAPNVLILRTYSKLGWAGLRLGYLLGDAKTISELNKVRLPYNINSLTQASADFFLDHFSVFEKQAEEICSEREKVSKVLAAVDGIELFPSQTNFLLLRIKNSDEIFEQLKQGNILIKNMGSHGGLLKNCLRITIGSREENRALIAALKEILA
ncbi:MAG: histidinol-phosphate transaminase [Mariprofundaceae bacterium]|nr:histidinol-phosphate transaminase [Mariprofundaceae bacterium]